MKDNEYISAETLDALWRALDDVEHYISGSEEREEVPMFADICIGETEEKTPPPTSLNLEELSARVSSCTACRLSEQRLNPVFGSGSPSADLMVIGEGPGEMEDRTGQPFVGKAGAYLDAWLSAISLSREENVYIANVVKCRPPQNRDPHEDEVAQCSPYLLRQIELIRPRMILCLGRFASHTLLSTTDSMRSLRGKVYRYHEIPTVVTYHPAAVLRNANLRRDVWEDLKTVASFLDLPLKQRES